MRQSDAETEGGHRLVVYVEKEDGSYGPMETGSYLVANYLDDLLEKQTRWKSENLEKLLKGEISAIAFYCDNISMTEADLAVRVDLRQSKVRKHMTPAGFRDATVDELLRYAEVFDVPVANLFQIFAPGAGGAKLVQRDLRGWLLTETRAEKA